MKLTAERFEEYMEQFYSGFVVSKFKVLSNRSKYITVEAEVLFYGTNTLIDALRIWSDVSKTTKAKAGFKAESLQIHEPRVKVGKENQYAFMELVVELDKEKIP